MTTIIPRPHFLHRSSPEPHGPTHGGGDSGKDTDVEGCPTPGSQDEHDDSPEVPDNSPEGSFGYPSSNPTEDGTPTLSGKNKGGVHGLGSRGHVLLTDLQGGTIHPTRSPSRTDVSGINP